MDILFHQLIRYIHYISHSTQPALFEMKALILAAGFGNRMRPLTNNQHKTLLSVSGLTILYRIIDIFLNVYM